MFLLIIPPGKGCRFSAGFRYPGSDAMDFEPSLRARFGNRVGLFCLAALVFGLVVARACLQSITIDEANAVLGFVAGPMQGAHWYPSSGNHVLNSALQKLVTSIFGISELTVRAPAILGAIVYICSALCFCFLLTSRTLLRLPLFLCLVLNPLVLDFLIAARGYSLAIGFLFAALTLIASAVLSRGEGGSFQFRARLASLCVALSFAANFSFAYVDAVTMLLFFFWAATTPARSRLGVVRLLECCFLPGIVTAIILCGPTVWNFPKSQLYYGSQSLLEMWRSIVSASFDNLNPNVFNPWLINSLSQVRYALPLACIAAVLSLLAAIETNRWRSHKPNSDASITLLRLLCAIAIVTFLLHWLAFHAARIPLPSDRTALPFVLLWVLIFGVALSLRFQTERRDFIRSGAIVILIATAVYFTGCLRLGPFRQWNFDADTKQLYWVVSDLRTRCGITSFGIDWKYSSALNFYRLAYRNTSIPNFDTEDTSNLPSDRSAYVISSVDSGDFIQQQHLHVIYHSREADSAVAIRACAGP
jgi:hypothetical protein